MEHGGANLPPYTWTRGKNEKFRDDLQDKKTTDSVALSSAALSVQMQTIEFCAEFGPVSVFADAHRSMAEHIVLKADAAVAFGHGGEE